MLNTTQLSYRPHQLCLAQRAHPSLPLRRHLVLVAASQLLLHPRTHPLAIAFHGILMVWQHEALERGEAGCILRWYVMCLRSVCNLVELHLVDCVSTPGSSRRLPLFSVYYYHVNRLDERQQRDVGLRAVNVTTAPLFCQLETAQVDEAVPSEQLCAGLLWQPVCADCEAREVCESEESGERGQARRIHIAAFVRHVLHRAQ